MLLVVCCCVIVTFCCRHRNTRLLKSCLAVSLTRVGCISLACDCFGCCVFKLVEFTIRVYLFVVAADLQVSNASLTSSPAYTESPVLETPPPASTTNQQQSSTSRSKSWSGRPLWMEKEYACRIKVPHTLVVHNYTRPTICQLCKKLLKGLFRQGLQCKG